MEACSNVDSLLSHRSRLQELLLRISDITASNQYCLLLDQYLELPSLLDPIITHHITSLCQILHTHLDTISQQQQNAETDVLVPPAKALCSLVKVRGPKHTPVYFPHSVKTLRSLIPHLIYAETHLRNPQFWHVRYVLLMWLSVAIRVPFPLDTILTPEQLSTALTHAKHALLETGPISDAAQFFLSRLLSRRDTHSSRIHLIQWATQSAATTSPAQIPALSLLAALFKHAHRDDVQSHIHPILSILPPLLHSHPPPSTRLAHLLSKLGHRVALAFLPPRPAAWRYTTPITQLRPSNAGNTSEIEPSPTPSLSEQHSEALETVIDLLLTSLQHQDTIVRWSAAKGISRITSRLPETLAHDVIEAVLDVFQDIQQARADATWHGACLCLAELARRGLILPNHSHFPKLFTALAKAAAFDVRRAANSVGGSVRDAACYTVWAIARAYAQHHVAPFAHFITEAMLPLALLDREVNCRRAASAALQECVGRLSGKIFVDGIDLIAMADYFSLGDRNAAYLTIAPQICQLGDGVYLQSVLDELYLRKLVHWDRAVRALAAKAIAKLVAVDRENVILNKVLPHLATRAEKAMDMISLHGIVLGFSELALVIGANGLQQVADAVRQIPMLCTKHKFLSGRTGNDMRAACCHLIQCIAEGAHELYTSSEKGMHDAEKSLQFLETILGCGQEDMYAQAASAYRQLCEQVIAQDEEWHIKVTRRLLEGISESKFLEHQRGYALAAGVCGDSRISGELIRVLNHSTCRSRDVEVRRNAALSLGRVSRKLQIEHLTGMLLALTDGMKDYDTDDRGDVGSWVREASMRSTAIVISNVMRGTEGQPSLAMSSGSKEAVLQAINCILEQCCSRIHRTREVAGGALKSICSSFAGSNDENDILSRLCKQISAACTFEIPESQTSSHDAFRKEDMSLERLSVFQSMPKLLHIPEVSKAVSHGFIYASGGMGTQGRLAREAYNDALLNRELDDLVCDVEEIARIVKAGNDRLTLPALNLLDYIAQTEVLAPVGEAQLKRVASAVRQCWRQRMGDIKQTSAAVQVLSSLASASDPRGYLSYKKGSLGKMCLEALALVLGCVIPRLRRIAAETIYMLLLQTGVDPYDEKWLRNNGNCVLVVAAMDLLLDTGWERLLVSVAREHRNKICEYLSIEMPRAVPRTVAVQK